MTVFGILLLEDMGQLMVYDSVSQHLPWFNVRYNGGPVDVTIYNLLHHTGGLIDTQMFPPTEEMTEAELIAFLDGFELSLEPSTKFAYSNIGYILLGLIVEAASGQSYEGFMTQAVFHPLGMYDTFTNVQSARATGRAIGGHRSSFFRPRAYDVLVSTLMMSSGGIYSSISDMARWTGIHFGTIAVSEQFQQIVQRSRIHHHATDAPFGGSTTYGAGWEMFEGGFGHSGFTPGFISDLVIFPDRDIAAVVLTNLNMPGLLWASLVADAVEGELTPIGTNMMAALDIGFSIVTIVVAAFSAVLFAVLGLNLFRHFTGGETSASWVAPGVSLAVAGAGLAIMYLGLPAMFGVPYADTTIWGPGSIAPATAALWAMLAVSATSLLANVFVL
ncbi:MAG: beta-lactamase family protein [Oscillospiraceae bacterium]|nr:beta-lactamase family protein [Oscillospiraceae bacterium]